MHNTTRIVQSIVNSSLTSGPRSGRLRRTRSSLSIFPDAPCYFASGQTSVHLGTCSHLFCRSRRQILRWVNQLQLIKRSQNALPAPSVLFHFDGGREVGIKFENILPQSG